MITLAEWNTWSRQRQTAYRTKLRQERARIHEKLRLLSADANALSAELHCISTWSPPVPIPMAEDFLKKVRTVAPRTGTRRTSSLQLKLVVQAK